MSDREFLNLKLTGDDLFVSKSVTNEILPMDKKRWSKSIRALNTTAARCLPSTPKNVNDGDSSNGSNDETCDLQMINYIDMRGGFPAYIINYVSINVFFQGIFTRLREKINSGVSK